jgi:lipopolysaccharide/colanic/teichoic acid biosynthesis glycosyltransferase
MSLREGKLIGRCNRPSEDIGLLCPGAKRAFDVFAATICLTLLCPLILVVSVAIKLNSRGPIFIRKTKFGYNNRPIHVFRFRSATARSHVTQVGRVLRRTGIDRIPQLINVLLGDMSIVGPAPSPSPRHLHDYGLMPMLAGIKPGMTRGVQITEHHHGFDAMKQSIDDDLHYVMNWSIFLDIKIILAVLSSER